MRPEPHPKQINDLQTAKRRNRPVTVQVQPDDFAPSSPAQAAALAGFASGPRCLAQLAAHLGCTLVTAAGHLTALRRRGLVLRLGSGVYVRADGVAAPSPFGHGRGCAVRHGRDRILVLLAGGPSSLQRIAAHIGCSAVVARDHLRALRERGLVARLGRATYARTDLLPLPARLTAAQPPPPVRERILALLADGPRHAGQIAAQVGVVPCTAYSYLLALRRCGLVVHLGHGVYGRSQAQPPALTLPAIPAVSAAVAGRARPVQDAIFACLADGPRRAEQVAAYIDRTTATATGHLAAMRRRGLVVRLGWGVYARADLVAAAHVPAVVARGHPVRDQLLACLSTKETRSHNDVARRADREPDRVLDHLRALVRAGLAQEIAPKCFRRSSPASAPAASPPA